MNKLKRFVRSIGLMIIALFLLGSLTACSGIDGDLASKADVNRKVAEEVESESYELVSVEHHDEERPKRDVYLYKSKERDLTFEAISTLSPLSIDGGVFGYTKSVAVHYVDAVRSIYAKDQEEILAGFSRNERGDLVYDSYDEISKISEAVVKLSQVYEAELSYNSPEWMKKNPLCKISFQHERADYEGYYIPVLTYDVDGSLDYDTVYNYFTYKHAEAVKKEAIIDTTTPKEAIERVHENTLESIFYKGDNLSKQARQEALEDKLINNTESTYYSYYYYPWDTYLVILDCGLTSEEYAPKWMEKYADAFGFFCHVKYKKGKIQWYFDDSEYEIRAKNGKHGKVTDFKIYKDGKDMKIPYVTCDDFLSPVGTSYVVGIPVENFADLFHKDYEIREDGSVLEFKDSYEFTR